MLNQTLHFEVEGHLDFTFVTETIVVISCSDKDHDCQEMKTWFGLQNKN